MFFFFLHAFHSYRFSLQLFWIFVLSRILPLSPDDSFVGAENVGWMERGSSTVVFIRFRVETRNGDNLPVNKSPRLHRFSNGITSDRVDEERVASDCVYVRARGRVNYSSERTLCRSRLPIVHEHPGIRDEVASPLLRSDDSRKSEWRNRVDAGRG